MTRFRAAAIHFSISCTVALVVMAAMFLLWYPGAYFGLMGGTLLLALIIGVDVCLGPLITLVIFNPAKKSLRFDLAVIALVQSAALIYGVYVMFLARPVYVVFIENHFRVAAANEISGKEYAKATRPEWRGASLVGPQVLGSNPPTDPQERSDLVFASAFGVDLHQIPKYYAPYAEKRQDVLKAARSLSILADIAPRNQQVIADFVRDQGRAATDFLFLPIRSQFQTMSVIVDARSGDFVTVLDAFPGIIAP